MKKNTKKIFTLSILTLFLFSFAFSFVAAQGGATGNSPSNQALNSPTLLKKITDPFVDMVTDWERGKVTPKVAKYLFFILLSTIVYMVLATIPGFNDMGFARGLVAGIVGLLSVAYLTPEEVYTMMVSYTAMGFVLAGFLPILILFFFTWEMASKRGNASQRAMMIAITWFMWLAYTVLALVKILDPPKGVSNVPIVAYVFVLFGVTMLFMNTKVFRLIRIWTHKAKKSMIKERIDTATAVQAANADAGEKLANKGQHHHH